MPLVWACPNPCATSSIGPEAKPAAKPNFRVKGLRRGKPAPHTRRQAVTQIGNRNEKKSSSIVAVELEEPMILSFEVMKAHSSALAK
jgi:hypothetical protein